MTRRGWWVVGTALVVATVVVGTVRFLGRPSDPVALPEVCAVPAPQTVQLLVPDADATFTGGDPAACNVQATGDDATYAALFLFVSQDVYGIDDDREETCDEIGRSPSADGPGEQS